MKSHSRFSSLPSGRLRPPTHDQIAALAHALWMDRGQAEGRDLEHWFEAERQLRGTVDPMEAARQVDPATAPAVHVARALDQLLGPPQPRLPTVL